MLAAGTTGTTAFLDTTLALADLDPAVRAAFRAPYATVARRRGIGGFVADIPATAADESTPALRRMSAGLRELTVPALFLRGPKDPVFGEGHLDDLTERLPHADVHRFEGAGHLIAEERPYADVVLDWLDEKVVDAGDAGMTATAAATRRTAAGRGSKPTTPAEGATPSRGHLWDALDARRDDDDTCLLYTSPSPRD